MITEKTARYAWYTEGAGVMLMQAEKERLEALLPQIFGFHLLEVGDPSLANLVTNSAISHRVLITKGMSETWPCSLLRGEYDHLPLKNDSVDAVVLPHTLEQTHHPHQLLREAHRVLIPEGQLIITGINPFSLWGAWYHTTRRIKHLPPTERLITMARIKDWLTLLDFKIISAEHFFFRPPIAKNGIMQRLKFMETLGTRCWPIFGGGYHIVAVKRVVTMTAIRPRWRPKKIWERQGVPKPSTRQGAESYAEDG